MVEVDVDTKELKVKFLDKVFDQDSYELRKEAVEYWIEEEEIISRMNNPRFAGGRGLRFIFDN